MRTIPALLIALSLVLPAHATDSYDSGAPASVPVPAAKKAAPAAAADPEFSQDMESPREEIGFDPKVKRDPYGNIIEEEEQKAAAPAAPKLRTDRNLRGDSQILRRNR